MSDQQPPSMPPEYHSPEPGQTPYYTPAPVVRPPSMDKAVMLMKVGAAFSVIQALVMFLLKDQSRELMIEELRKRDPSVTPETIDATLNMSIIGGMLFALIGVLLWLWMAAKNGQGKSWARVTASVFFALNAFFTVIGFAQPAPMLSKASSAVYLLIGLVVIVLLYQKESSDFYNASERVLR
ncbi:hypothetical protein SAMN05421595_2351 [Austwickia chelonae]|uniref:Uncharacterized protein n=1 Tax=Austwickia chelonae NBRC 105200 TaxID=1184607 RepID=K6WA33_9MICO|nr:hypothetical protein [Austwickia chelonae]GAB78697.1 hypothetical protein AUCHE_16_01170 [Austwickia chelonae NBRC 105200]SEW34803.1 hypothetical protein SAMN05421595_2351 [Austwickia chelonae]